VYPNLLGKSGKKAVKWLKKEEHIISTPEIAENATIVMKLTSCRKTSRERSSAERPPCHAEGRLDQNRKKELSPLKEQVYSAGKERTG